MGNWTVEACGPAYAVYKQEVLSGTWGHLAPKKNTTYKGQILTCKSGYGGSDGKIIDMKWDKLDDSPWIFDHINKYIWEVREQMKEDGVYLIKATFRNYRIWSKITKVYSL